MRKLPFLFVAVGIMQSASALAETRLGVGSDVLFDDHGIGVSYVRARVLDLAEGGLVQTDASDGRYVGMGRAKPYRPVPALDAEGHQFRVGESVLFDDRGLGFSYVRARVLDLAEGGLVQTDASDGRYVSSARIRTVAK